MNAQITRLFCLLMASGLLANPALAQFEACTGDHCGTDGVFNPQADIEIDLSLAEEGQWDTTPGTGNGVYDPELWAVVFKYITIDIPDGVTVRFSNHPSGAPVVWLAQGQVTIEAGAEVNLNGDPGELNMGIPFFAEPGPGGFAGGQGSHGVFAEGSAGFGPGGGLVDAGFQRGGNAGHNGPGGTGNPGQGCTNAPGGAGYGHPEIHRLMGGSGGSGGNHINSKPPGAGGGAILIATSDSITLDGIISARGGDGIFGPTDTGGGGGSGGTIRLMAATAIGGTGGASVARGNHGDDAECNPAAGGRLRAEAPLITAGVCGSCSTVVGFVFPELEPTAPTLVATFVDAEEVPPDPDAGILTPDVLINTLDELTIEIEATNIPAGTTILVRVMLERGEVITVTSSPLVDQGGGVLAATAPDPEGEEVLLLPPGRMEIQLRANWTP